MNRRIQALVATLMLAASPAAAQDQVGFYFDTAGSATTATTTTPGEFVQAWLILSGASGTDGLGSWRGEVRVEHADGTPANVQWLYMGGAQNFDAPPSFDVATFTLMPWVPDLVLATVMIQVPDPSQKIKVYLSGHRFPVHESSPGYPLNHPEYAHGVGYTPVAMVRNGGNSYVPVAVINDDGVPPTQAVVTFYPTFTGAQYAGAELSGTLRITGQNLDRALEGVVEFQIPGMELRRLPTDSGYPSPDPSPWTTGPVTSRLEVPPLTARDLFEFRTTATAAGEANLGVVFTTGDVVHTYDNVLTIFPSPCAESGFAYGAGGGDMEGSVLTFHPHVEAFPDPEGYVRAWALGDFDIVAEPQLSGSPAFVITNPEPVTLPASGYSRQFNLVFAPTTSGWHEAELSFVNDACGTVTLRGYAVPTAISAAGDLPVATRLLPAAPNPFNPTTTVSFELASAGRARVAVYGIDGRLVTVLADEHFTAGPAQRVWSGRDTAGRAVASGVYLVRLEMGDVRSTQRVILLK